MDSEEFYDSLEESSESEYDSVEGTPTNRITERSFDTELPDDVIPFYDRQLSRSEIKLEKIVSKVQDFSRHKKKWTSKKRFFVQDNGQAKKSYLEMFYARIGIVPANTARPSTISMSPKSFITCDDYSVDSIFQNSEDCSTASCDEFRMQFPNPEELALSVTSFESKLNSISEDEFKIQLKTISKPSVRKVHDLGKLEPELPNNKLELLRKRQHYGKMASLTNRLKMRERKADYDLQREIRNSKVWL